MTISPFDHPVLSGLFADEETAAQFSFRAELGGMLRFEVALAQAQARTGLIPRDASARIKDVCATFEPDVAALRQAMARDGVLVPNLIAQLRAAIGDTYAPYLHYGATSQDVIDTSLILRLKTVRDIFDARMDAIDAALQDLRNRFGERPLMGFTRMQAAIPITVADRIDTWQAPIIRHRQRLIAYRENSFIIQFGGAAGTLEKLGDAAAKIRADMATSLDLADGPQWHNQRDRITEFANILSLMTGTLGKIGLDITLLAQAGKEIQLAGGGGSSAMPHKQNPVAAETLVALARYNDAQIALLHAAMLHEQERSGAAWMLEWLALPSMVMATGTAMKLTLDLLGNTVSLGNTATEPT